MTSTSYHLLDETDKGVEFKDTHTSDAYCYANVSCYLSAADTGDPFVIGRAESAKNLIGIPEESMRGPFLLKGLMLCAQ